MEEGDEEEMEEEVEEEEVRRNLTCRGATEASPLLSSSHVSTVTRISSRDSWRQVQVEVQVEVGVH